MKRETFAVAVLASILLIFILSGCTGNRYAACCVKSEIYDITTNPPAILPTPKCVFPDEAVFGNCDPAATASLGSTALCVNNSKRFCSDINVESECGLAATCKWDGLTSSCKPSNAASPEARWLMPICQDGIPSNCANDMCQAMMCGYTKLKTGPLPTANDFPGDPATITKPFPNEYGNEKVNLQGTSCSFKTMNKALYNNVIQSRGGLWVNSFRFGVGRSFADYEQSRLFFPASDKFCSTSVTGGKDRFVNYMNAPSTWCAETSSYYHCNANSLNFSSQAECSLYCFGKTPSSSDPDCFAGPSGEHKYVCLESKFAYADQQECKAQCSVISDPTMCTNNRIDYPFLESDLRYKYKLNADYVYSTNTVGSDDYDGFASACKQENWRARGSATDRHYNCDDFYPWASPYLSYSLWQPASAICDENSPTYNEDECGYRQGFWYHPSRVFSIDLDYNYYKEELSKAIPVGERDKKAYFECDAGDCMSGVCDKATYSRSLCYNATLGIGGQAADGEIYNDCNCTKSGDSVNCGSWRKGVYRKTGESDGIATLENTGGIVLAPNIGKGTEYFVLADPSETSTPAEGLGVISQCRITPVLNGEIRCLYQDNRDRNFLKGTNNGNCPNVNAMHGTKVKAWEYKMAFTDYTTSGGITYGKLGENCRLMDKSASINLISPYLQIKTFGWCQACTYSTLAVQKVNFDALQMNNYECLSFRGDYQYDAQKGKITDTYVNNLDNPANMKYGFSVSPVKKAYVTSRATSPDQNGPVGRDFYDPPAGTCNHRATYKCEDGWDSQSSTVISLGGGCGSGTYVAHGWHQISSPDQAYLIEKMRTYMQSNVMPILDVQGPQPNEETTVSVSDSDWINFTYIYGTSYAPSDICTKWGGDGAAIYALGDLALLSAASGGSIGKDDTILNSALAGYLGLTQGANTYTLNGAQSLLYRALLMKKYCPHPPLAALDIGTNTNLDVLIGTGNLADPNNGGRGVLHKFFFNPAYTGGGLGYGWRVANGRPDDYANNIDLLLQEWTPMCAQGTGKEEKTRLEFDKRLAFSRAFLGNFSKPSLIWKFNFPQNTQCDSAYFLEYLFSHQGDMVDAGIIGLVYDNWRTATGEPYIGDYGSIPDDPKTGGSWTNPAGRAGLSSGTNGGIAAGAIDPDSGTSLPTKKTDTFCALQNQSRKMTGISKQTYGQKIYAQQGACACEPCSISDADNGRCIDAANRNKPQYLTNANLDQLFCLDGVQCTMPNGFTNYSYYRCPATCLRNTCLQCDSPAFTGNSVYCRVETSDGAIYQTVKDYGNLSDSYWDIVASLPGNSKCCLNQIEKKPGELEGTMVNYTYVSRIGVKQRNEFLQFPRRGQEEVDCGRGVDTSVLQYCNIQIPMSENHLYCSRIK